MMRTLIVYRSRTGFTKRYAEQIAARTGFPLLDARDATAQALAGYDRIVYGGRLHAGVIDGLKPMRALCQRSGAKELVVFVTGGTPNAATEIIDEVWRRNLSPDEQSAIPHFYMQSGICYERMSVADRAVMKLAAALMGQKKDKTATEAGFEQAITQSYDISSERYAEPLIQYLLSGGDHA